LISNSLFGSATEESEKWTYVIDEAIDHVAWTAALPQIKWQHFTLWQVAPQRGHGDKLFLSF